MNKDIGKVREQENHKKYKNRIELYVEENRKEDENTEEGNEEGDKVVEGKKDKQVVDASIEDHSNEHSAKDELSLKATPYKTMPKWETGRTCKRLVKKGIARNIRKDQGNHEEEEEGMNGSRKVSRIEKTIDLDLSAEQENNKEFGSAEGSAEAGEKVSKASAEGNGGVGGNIETMTDMELNAEEENCKETRFEEMPVEGNIKDTRVSGEGDGKELFKGAGASEEGNETQWKTAYEAPARVSASGEAGTSEKTLDQLKAKGKIAKHRLSGTVKKKIVKRTRKAQRDKEDNNENVLMEKNEDCCVEKKDEVELEENSVGRNEKVAKASVECNGSEDFKVVDDSMKGNGVHGEKVAEASAQLSAAGEAEILKMKSPHQLKAKAKIAKLYIPYNLKKKIVKSTSKFQRNKEENTTDVLVDRKEGNCSEEKNELEEQNYASNDISIKKMETNLANETDKDTAGRREQNQRLTKKCAVLKKNKKGKLPSISENKQLNEEVARPAEDEEQIGRMDDLEISKKTEKKEKIGGLIFMCNAQTKPDCFHFRIMGVSETKKDLVMGIRPGLKLFLYDYELKLLYGIYQASSSGGMKMERKAFRGSFPAQVRFRVLAACDPIPECVFRKAIKENYETNNKFKTELTPQQVNRLRRLFQAPIAPTAPPVPAPPALALHEGVGVRSNSALEIALAAPATAPYARGKEASTRDRYTYSETSSRDYYAQSNHITLHEWTHERDGAGLSMQIDLPDDLYLSEREYRRYGLRRVGRSQNHAIAPADHYRRDLEGTELMRQPHVICGDLVHVNRDTIQANPSLTERKYLSYDLAARGEVPSRGPRDQPVSASRFNSYAWDPYYSYSYYGVPAPETYLPSSREENRLYSTYTGSATSSYCEPRNAKITPASAFSDYALLGPSFSYR